MGTFGVGAFFCIDADAIVHERLQGPIRLQDVQKGDSVLSDTGVYAQVTDIDLGRPLPEQDETFIRIETAEGLTLVLTRDHEIDGLPAGEWSVGDDLLVHGRWQPIQSVTPTEPIVCGDLRLAGGLGYMANGFRVGSMIERYRQIVGAVQHGV